MHKYIIRADKALRKRVIIGYIATVLLGAMFLLWLLPETLESLLGLRPRAATRILYGAIAFWMLVLVALGGYCFWLGHKVLQYESFPPPGMRVIQHMELMRGKDAVWRGRLLVFGAAVLIFVGLFGATYTINLAIAAMA